MNEFTKGGENKGWERCVDKYVRDVGTLRRGVHQGGGMGPLSFYTKGTSTRDSERVGGGEREVGKAREDERESKVTLLANCLLSKHHYFELHHFVMAY